MRSAEVAGEAEITDESQMAALADKLLAMLAPGAWVLVKGGHLSGADVPDLLTNGKESVVFTSVRAQTKNTHGTGCTLSSALATLLPQSETVPEAMQKAKHYISQAIAHADELTVGHGHGPVHHFWEKWQ